MSGREPPSHCAVDPIGPFVKRGSLYSRRRSVPEETKPPEAKRVAPSGNLYKRHERAALFAAGAIVGLCMVSLNSAFAPVPPAITQEALDAAVARTLQAKPLPSPAIKAYAAVRDSIVRVRAIGVEQD